VEKKVQRIVACRLAGREVKGLNEASEWAKVDKDRRTIRGGAPSARLVIGASAELLTPTLHGNLAVRAKLEAMI